MMLQPTNLGHATIDNKLMPINKRALVSSQEENCLSLLNSLTETTHWKVDLAAMALCLIISQPVL